MPDTREFEFTAEHAATLKKMLDSGCLGWFDGEASEPQAIAAALAHIESLEEQSRRWYLPDGTFELLDSAEAVIERRKEYAAEIAGRRSRDAEMWDLSVVEAVDRLKAFVAAYEKMRGLDPEHIYSLHNEAIIRLSDLRMIIKALDAGATDGR